MRVTWDCTVLGREDESYSTVVTLSDGTVFETTVPGAPNNVEAAYGDDYGDYHYYYTGRTVFKAEPFKLDCDSDSCTLGDTCYFISDVFGLE